MALRSAGKPQEEQAIVERAFKRLYGRSHIHAHQQDNATALITYLVSSGIRDEDDIVELARIANGKRYDPSNGSFL